ncbi:hypothetical protein AVEN_33961-1 [Araneus ventricosus]|uniref:Uncharacterized protein n=1 Tax=Araneus ventricosus TaxID=182803 RepID=A0A4Y2MHX0_ARAVE|nr:hypothetical protein AVEN_33961-1 [Araneus ventricosus]
MTKERKARRLARHSQKSLDRIRAVDAAAYRRRVEVEIPAKGANTRSVSAESRSRDATCDPVFFNGVVHTGAAKLCNRFSSRAYNPSLMKQLRFRRQIVAWSDSNE